MSRRAFTIIELMMALAIGSLVVSGTLGLFVFLTNSEKRLSTALPQRTDLTITHTVIMRTMGTLAAGIPLTPEDEREENDDDDDDDADNEDAPPDITGALEGVNDPALQAQLSALFGESLSEETIEQVAQTAFVPPEAQFEIYDSDRNTPGFYFPTLEVALTNSPLPRTRSLLYNEPTDQWGEEIDRDFNETMRGTIRGAFEVIEVTPDEMDFALQWVWLDEPDLAPRILLEDIANIQWKALVPLTNEDTGETEKVWLEVHSAYLIEDFPFACRVQIEMQDGLFIDWMFEAAVSEPEQPR